MIYPVLRRLLFCLPTEIAHELALSSLDKLPAFANNPPPANTAESVTVMGLQFPNAVGIAAGLDKNADHLAGLSALGCGFVEVGTVTPKAQPGNPKPRLFRLTEQRALINRMGFNNKGIDHLVQQVAHHRGAGIVGINIGKNLSTAIEQANDDYLTGLKRAYPHADYITVNISSPNTPGLRQLQLGEQLAELLSRLRDSRKALADEHARYVPIAVKIAPDMQADDIRLFCSALVDHGMDAVIAGNTTLTRTGTEGSKHTSQAGGLSGAPLTQLSRQTIRSLAQTLQGELPVIGCGGIMSAADALGHREAGADLVQIYTGFIYRGPELINDIRSAFAQHESNMT